MKKSSLKRQRAAAGFRDSPRWGQSLKSRQRVGFSAGEEAVDLVIQRAFVNDQLAGKLAGAFE
ncbi:MAG: hypothetical protein E6G02_03885 [Actinobacteria bacterium]|nr:MAG: hypothetical protein E6G02_03885 [Actinomycetota bacterium]